MLTYLPANSPNGFSSIIKTFSVCVAVGHSTKSTTHDRNVAGKRDTMRVNSSWIRPMICAAAASLLNSGNHT